MGSMHVWGRKCLRRGEMLTSQWCNMANSGTYPTAASASGTVPAGTAAASTAAVDAARGITASSGLDI